MAQFNRPSTDILTGNWAPAGGRSDLWAELDETSPDTLTYVSNSLGPDTADSFDVGLSDTINDPDIHTEHTMSFRFRLRNAPGGNSCSFQFTLKEGVTNIASKNTSVGDSGVWIDDSYELTEAEAGNISDYGNLTCSVGVTALPANFGDVTPDVSWFELKVPDVPAGRNVWVYDGTQWRKATKVWVYDGTTWQEATDVNVYDGTTWLSDA